MKAVQADARRYVWCRANALWTVSMARSLVEDAQGAQQAGQDGLLRYVARTLGEACAVAVHLVLSHERPMPLPALRASWALEQLQGHELWRPCWDLIRGDGEVPGPELVSRCEDLMTRTEAVVGEVPNVLTPEGYYPAIATARTWLELMDAVGEQGFLPASWTRTLQT